MTRATPTDDAVVPTLVLVALIVVLFGVYTAVQTVRPLERVADPVEVERILAIRDPEKITYVPPPPPPPPVDVFTEMKKGIEMAVQGKTDSDAQVALLPVRLAKWVGSWFSWLFPTPPRRGRRGRLNE